ncbi:REST corepressor 3-like [Tropilaelaps mercedesae]|uniref:REST corepressor 3-like n=1 Tax=Tropilaelaps mercedesae TaxID=418985 RepID=A0A1V9XFW4_9ACAR|nr:REST corepressor 3-like [Tropilaelaps mercedesae]
MHLGLANRQLVRFVMHNRSMEKLSFPPKQPRVGSEFQVEVLPEVVEAASGRERDGTQSDHPADLIFAPGYGEPSEKLLTRPVKWSAAETVNYGRCFQRHAQDFVRYREHLPDKSMADILDLFYKREGIKIYRRSMVVQRILAIEKARRSNLPEEQVDGRPRRRSARSRPDTSGST